MGGAGGTGYRMLGRARLGSRVSQQGHPLGRPPVLGGQLQSMVLGLPIPLFIRSPKISLLNTERPKPRPCVLGSLHQGLYLLGAEHTRAPTRWDAGHAPLAHRQPASVLCPSAPPHAPIPHNPPAQLKCHLHEILYERGWRKEERRAMRARGRSGQHPMASAWQRQVYAGFESENPHC